MKTVKKDVHYCEFCNKRSLSKGHMNTHEKHCTANPDRRCRMCDNYEGGSPNNIREIVDELRKRFILETIKEYPYDGATEMTETIKAKWIGEPITIDEVRKLVDGCPNCMLAIIRQAKFAYHYFEGTEFGEFDYKKEFSERSSEIRQIQYDNQPHYGY